jgi:hypothetical protein
MNHSKKEELVCRKFKQKVSLLGVVKVKSPGAIVTRKISLTRIQTRRGSGIEESMGENF